MMKELFDTYVSRENGVFWLKSVLTPREILEKGKRGFSGAEFEFPTCPAFSRGVAEAAQNGLFGYTLPGERYRERVCWWMEQVRGFTMEPEWIVTTHGTIFSLATLIRLLTLPGEGIIILPPCYNRYEQAAQRLGRRTVRVPLKEEKGRYGIDFPALEQAMAGKGNRILVLTNPNNPTGTVFSPETLKEIMSLAEKYDVTVFSDEIFAEVIPGGKRVPSLCEISRGSHCVVATGMGKVFSLTGVNHANVLIPDQGLRERFIAQRDRDHYGSLDPMVHAGLLSAYTQEGKEWVEELNETIRGNGKLVCETLCSLWPQVQAEPPEGTFVLWVEYGRAGLSRERLEALLGKACFVGDWGEEYYGSPDCMRYSLALPRREIENTMEELKKAVGERK